MFIVRIQSIVFCHYAPKRQAERLYNTMRKKETNEPYMQ